MKLKKIKHMQTKITATVTFLVLAASVGIALFTRQATLDYNRSGAVSGPGIWISKAELDTLPMSGSAWNQVKQAADASWPEPVLYDNSNRHDIYILAGALVYARMDGHVSSTQTNPYRQKVANGIKQMMDNGYDDGSQSLTGAARNLTAYPIAAELINLENYDSTLNNRFKNFLTELIDYTYSSGAPPRSMSGNARGWGNGATMARLAHLSASLYLGNTADVQMLAKYERRFLGDLSVTDIEPVYNADPAFVSWQVSSNESQWAGIQLKGATKNGHLFDGIIPADHRRDSSGGSDNVYNSSTFPGDWQTTYPWVNLQAATPAVAIFARHGFQDAYTWGDSAILRAHQTYNIRFPQQYPGRGWTYFPSGPNLIPLLNFMYPEADFEDPFGPQGPTKQGFTLGWTHYTHAGRTGATPPPPPPVTPTVTITSPASGSTVSGSVSVAATTSTPVVGVQFKVDGANLGSEDTTSPYSVSWNTAEVSNGSHTIQASARDSLGNVGVASIAVTVSNSLPDTIAPVISAFSASPSTLTEGSLLTASFTATDVGGSNLSEALLMRAPQTSNCTDASKSGCSWSQVNAKSAPNGANTWTSTITDAPSSGTYYYGLHVLDKAGNRGYEPATAKATVNPNQTFSRINLDPNSLTFEAVSLGATPAAQVAVLSNTGAASMGYTAASNQNWCHVAPVSGTLAAGSSANLSVSVDSPSNVGTFACQITINAPNADNTPQAVQVTYDVAAPQDPTPPTVSITSHANGAGVPRRSTVTLQATASDNVGVARVEFFVNNSRVCSDSAAPYSCQWSVPPANKKTYNIQAQAFDLAGNMATSTISVTSR